MELRSSPLDLFRWLGALAMIGVGAGCGDTERLADAAPVDAADDAATAEAGTLPPDGGGARPDAEPDGSVLRSGDHARQLSVEDRNRQYVLHVPVSYDASQPTPLVMVFHGGSGTGAMIQNALGFDPMAAEEGALMAYPDGIENNWNDGRGTTDAEIAGVDDVAFVRALIDDVATVANVDEDRVFAAGVSNGGMFVHRLGCELSDRLRGIAAVIAAMPSPILPGCEPASPLSVLGIQGTDDPFIPIEGGDSSHDVHGIGDGGPVESAEVTRQHWIAVTGCATPQPEMLEPVDPADPTRVTRWSARSCTEGARVDYYVIEGMGHTWPPLEASAPRISGPTSHQLDATRTVWSFFLGG